MKYRWSSWWRLNGSRNYSYEPSECMFNKCTPMHTSSTVLFKALVLFPLEWSFTESSLRCWRLNSWRNDSSLLWFDNPSNVAVSGKHSSLDLLLYPVRVPTSSRRLIISFTFVVVPMPGQLSELQSRDYFWLWMYFSENRFTLLGTLPNNHDHLFRITCPLRGRSQSMIKMAHVTCTIVLRGDACVFLWID